MLISKFQIWTGDFWKKTLMEFLNEKKEVFLTEFSEMNQLLCLGKRNKYEGLWQTQGLLSPNGSCPTRAAAAENRFMVGSAEDCAAPQGGGRG